MGCNNAGRGLATLFWNTYYVALLVLLLAQVMPGVSHAVRPKPGASVGNNADADADANADAVAAGDAATGLLLGDDPSPGKRSINYFGPESEYWLTSKNHYELTTNGRKVEGLYPETTKTTNTPVRGDLWTIKIVDCANITLPAPPSVGGNRRKKNQTCSKVYIMNDVNTGKGVRYICMDRKGRVEMRNNATAECVFIEEHVQTGFYRYYSHHWYVTHKNRENRKPGHCEKMMKNKCGKKEEKNNNKKKNKKRRRQRGKEDACKWFIELTSNTRKKTISTTRKGMCSRGGEGAHFQRLDPNETYTIEESTIRSNIKTSTDPPAKIGGGRKKGKDRGRKKGGRKSDSNGPRSPFSNLRPENPRRHNHGGSRTRTRTKSQPREDRKDGPLQRKAGPPWGSSMGLMSLSSSEWPSR